MTEITLRPYQTERIQLAQTEWNRGNYSLLAPLATGTGKTELALGLLAAELASGKIGRILFLVGAIGLVTQPLARIDSHWHQFFGMCGIVQADKNDVRSQFIMATWQSLTRGRVEDILAFGPITHLIIDEAHHSVCEGYGRIIARLKKSCPELRVLGITATPKRADKVGLRGVFDTVLPPYSIGQAIRDGWLSPFNALGISLEADISNVRETKDGWDKDELGNILSAENIMEIVLANWQQYCEGRKTIGFTASIAQADRFAAYFRSHGVPAKMICGETEPLERLRLQKELEDGVISVLFNVQVLTEGIDIPAVSAVMMVAPTKSDVLYVQRLGRGLRLYPGKADCTVLDFAPVGGRNIIMAGDVLGVSREIKKAVEKAERQQVLFSFKFDEFGQSSAIDPSELIVHVLDLLGKHHLAWYVDDHGATAAVGKSTSLFIELPNLARVEKAEAVKRAGGWKPEYDAAYKAVSSFGLWLVDGKWAQFQGYYPTMDAAKDKGDALAEGREEAQVLAEKDSTWRRKPVSEKQINYLKQLGVEQVPATSGKAAQLISARKAWNAVQDAKRVYA